MLLMASLQQQMTRFTAHMDEQVNSLKRVVGDTNRMMSSTMDVAATRMTELSRTAIEPAVSRFGEATERAANRMDHSTHQYNATQEKLTAMVIRRMWMASIAMIVATVLVFAVAVFALIQSRDARAEAHALSAQVAYLNLVNQADWIPCGEDRLCARVEDKATHYGSNKEYRVIALRRVATEPVHK